MFHYISNTFALGDAEEFLSNLFLLSVLSVLVLRDCMVWRIIYHTASTDRCYIMWWSSTNRWQLAQGINSQGIRLAIVHLGFASHLGCNRYLFLMVPSTLIFLLCLKKSKLPSDFSARVRNRSGNLISFCTMGIILSQHSQKKPANTLDTTKMNNNLWAVLQLLLVIS